MALVGFRRIKAYLVGKLVVSTTSSSVPLLPSFRRAEKEGQLAGATSAEERLQADKVSMAAKLDAAKAAADSLESAVSMLRRANAGLDAELQQLKVRLEISWLLAAGC